MTTTVHFGAHSDEWSGVKPLADLGVNARIEILDAQERPQLFLIAHAAPAVVVGQGAKPAGSGSTYAECCRQLECVVMEQVAGTAGIAALAAVQYAGGHPMSPPRVFTAVEHDSDVLFSATHVQPECVDDETAWRLAATERHAFVETDIVEKAADDLTIVEREIKLDSSCDPRSAAWNLAIGDQLATFSGTPIPDIHFHRIYDVGDSGIFEMTCDPAAGPQLLKYKYELGDPADAYYRRFEVVEPSTPENFRRIAESLGTSTDFGQIPVTPYFERNRVKTNVYVAQSRSVFEVFADHSEFVTGRYAPFDQVEIEYVGVIDTAGIRLDWGLRTTPQLDRDFAAVQRLVIDAFASAAIQLVPSRRRKYDWAIAEVLRKNDDPSI